MPMFIWPPKLYLQRKKNGEWWIRGGPDKSAPDCGPYATKAAAEEDMRGLLRHFTDPTLRLIVNGPDKGKYATVRDHYESYMDG